MLRISLKEALTEVLYDKNRKYVNRAARAFDLVSSGYFSRLATATSSQSSLGHDSRHRHPPYSDLKVPTISHCFKGNCNKILPLVV